MSFYARVPVVSCVLLLLLLGCVTGADAEEQGCYTSGSVAGIVIATVVVTLVMGGLAAAFVWYLWKQKKVGYGNGKSQEKPIACPPMSPDKQLIARESNDYAFDNPYFKDDETDTATPDAAEKGEAGYHVDNGDITPVQNPKASNGTTGQQKKNRPFSSLPFHAVFHPSGKKQRATMDDTYISKHLERITVPLRGHDFTGLGFNICGNMRDGIFVKDVLHRGPASESGKIKAGDRIVGVTVSFGAMVYEDALTILSYASPYDVKLEIEKNPTTTTVGGVPHLPSSSPKRLGASTSFRSNGQRRLFHPLYRSQSIDDLTQIGKDNFLSGNVTGNQRDSNSSATPKRSQSVEASNGGIKTRSAYALKSADEAASKSLSSNKSRKSSTSSCDSTSKVATAPTVPEPTLQESSKEEAPCVKKEAKSSRFRVEQINVKSEIPSTQLRQAPPVKPARDTHEEKQPTEVANAADLVPEENQKRNSEMPVEEAEVKINIQTENSPVATEAEVENERPTAPPRKAGTPAKRRAPAPPPAPVAKTETSAVVHRADDVLDAAPTTPEENLIEPELDELPPPPPPITDLPDFPPSDTIPDPDLGSSDTSSVASGGHTSQKDTSKDEPSSPSKRKASSLGDLTKLDPAANKKASTSSAILERAVSLDFQQSLPSENLIKQKKILHAPTFEDDDESREGDFNDMDVPSLKRWDDGLDKVFVALTNGEAKPNEDLSKVDDDESSADETTLKKSEAVDLQSETKEKIEVTEDLDLNSSGNEVVQQASEDTEILVTSTPARKLIEVKNFIKDDDDSLDEIPYLATAKQQNSEESSSKHSIRTSSTSIPVFSPVTISIPVIKPDLTHYEKLPSPPPASTHPALDPSWRISKSNTTEENGRSPLERISVQSLYRPIFTNKEVTTSEELVSDSNAEKMVNGNDSDSSEHYSTAQESNTTISSVETSTMSVTLSPTVANNVTTKAPSNVAGFAKTLIIPGPNEVESLLSLATEPNTPPPNLEPPPKPIENE